MKASRAWFFGIVFVLFAILQIVGGMTAIVYTSHGESIAGDLRLRYNESRCAHQGVNSFRIWNREMTLAGFAPYSRPDMESVTPAPGDAVVHAYPPWHTSLFYFYGWMPELMCMLVMALVFGICLSYVVCECWCLAEARFTHPSLVALFALALIANPAAKTFCYLNYGVLVLAAFLLMNRALEKGHDVSAGLCWSVMMIKPQVALLFVWPLFWRRRYLAIATSAAVCLGETCVTACLVGESPIDLILQVPLIGKPYEKVGHCILAEVFLKPLVGDRAIFVLMVAFFVLTSFATWLLRKNRDFLVLCVPVVLAIPLWTYNNAIDRVIMLPAFIVMAGSAFSAGLRNRWGVIALAYGATMAASCLWWLASDFGYINASGHPLVFIGITVLANVVLFVFLMMLVCKERGPCWKKP